MLGSDPPHLQGKKRTVHFEKENIFIEGNSSGSKSSY
jgi:hypothetical protein